MFCATCGNQLSDANAKFCNSCGAPVAAAVAMDAGSTPTPSAAPAGAALGPSHAAPAATQKGKSSPWLNLILVVLAFFLVLGIAAAGVVTYLAYRVKHKIEEAKTEYGLDKLGKLAEKASGSSGTVQARDVCSLLSKQEVSEITGVAITDATRCVSCSCR
jgi:hypothetical protein